MKISRGALLIVSLWFALGVKPSLAAWDEYDDSQSHPLRIVAYLVHPAAFLVEWTVFRPFHFLVSATEAQEALFGHTPHPPVLSDPGPPRASANPQPVSITAPAADEPQAVVPAAAHSPAENVRIAERP
jgi:hypothetical protein